MLTQLKSRSDFTQIQFYKQFNSATLRVKTFLTTCLCNANWPQTNGHTNTL